MTMIENIWALRTENTIPVVHIVETVLSFSSAVTEKVVMRMNDQELNELHSRKNTI